MQVKASICAGMCTRTRPKFEEKKNQVDWGQIRFSSLVKVEDKVGYCDPHFVFASVPLLIYPNTCPWIFLTVDPNHATFLLLPILHTYILSAFCVLLVHALIALLHGDSHDTPPLQIHGSHIPLSQQLPYSLILFPRNTFICCCFYLYFIVLA